LFGRKTKENKELRSRLIDWVDQADVAWRAGLLVARQSAVCPLPGDRLVPCDGIGNSGTSCAECRMQAAQRAIRREDNRLRRTS